MESLQEISKYLSPNTRFDVKICALNHVLRVTATTDGRELLLKLPEILIQLVTFVQDSCAAISKCAAQILVNITGDESGTNAMLIISESSNSTEINKSDLVTQEFSQNLIKVCLRYFMDRNRCVIQLILPFTEYSDSLIRRGGIVGTLKNCTFDTENHVWLLSPEIDLLSYLLLPLAGPEEFDDEDMSKLPINLQYLPETKTRETDPDIRLMLLEALNQLCATKVAREMLREANTYLILRELHKWEKDKNCLLACENVVDILIKTEKEIGLDNLKEVEVPSAYTEMFHKMDKEFISNT
ncbi:PREDICTED: protein HGH1 homolog isoform X2 [Trachymyrmex septentrionalis]|uniref:protein HGH1 homolog isoform X2 n=1 Tax=Trachymyrmex septentrionalis TaxID=34720 RepID=UPI00084F1F54|nr:PREDICTED: protein HGH1 homolog isoform X2 [Trachymyrmex septentrionalis]